MKKLEDYNTAKESNVIPQDMDLTSFNLLQEASINSEKSLEEYDKNNFEEISYRTGFSFKVGDILIKNGKEVSLNTTRQLTTKQFISKYANANWKWIKVYKPKHSDIAKNAAKWADRNYFSSSGSATQNKFPKYTIATNLTSTNYVYCSKIIYQAYYYGSGNKSYVWPKVTQWVILPYDLPLVFTLGNSPKKVKTY